jgi:hypothetical protein
MRWLDHSVNIAVVIQDEQVHSAEREDYQQNDNKPKANVLGSKASAP